jgi:hypothetical protein
MGEWWGDRKEKNFISRFLARLVTIAAHREVSKNN